MAEEKKKITIYIDNNAYEVDEGMTVLHAARSCGYRIPALCSWMGQQCSLASCRVCVVRMNNERVLKPACSYIVYDGLRVSINDPMAVAARRTAVELLLSNHSMNCQSCRKNGQCELLEVARQVGAREGFYEGSKTEVTIDEVAPGIVRDTSKCILCGRCIAQCKNTQGIGILGFENRGFHTIVGPAGNRSFSQVPCIQCGQCTLVCPTGALMEKNSIPELDRAFRKKKHVIAFVAPAVRAAIGEEFGLPLGTSCTGKLAAAMRRLGFEKIFDLNFGADLTIMEEANEFVRRLSKGTANPMITSCSPGWINYIELNYPELTPHLSSCKSPQQMMGAIIKSYYAQKNGIDPKDICVVSIMPCTAKKDEIQRKQMEVDGIRDVDISITTRELGALIRRLGMEFSRLPDAEFDCDLLGRNSGAGVIFGVTGGVMEAAVRTAYHIVTGGEMDPVEFLPVRGLDGIKEATLEINDLKINIAVCSGMKNAKIILEQIKNGTCKYDFVEVMGCPGGCINGGGQPYVFPHLIKGIDGHVALRSYRTKRMYVLYSEDRNKAIRKSHLNPDVQALYQDFLGEPGSPLAKKLLHTSYNMDRDPFPDLPKKK